jgi:hypothetical protein
MSALSEAARIVMQQRPEALRAGRLALPFELWARLQCEMSAWCSEHDRHMLTTAEINRPNFMFKGLWVYPE